MHSRFNKIEARLKELEEEDDKLREVIADLLEHISSLDAKLEAISKKPTKTKAAKNDKRQRVSEYSSS